MIAALTLTGILVVGGGAVAQAKTYSSVWGELNGNGYVVHYSTLRAHEPSIQPRMRLDQVTAFNFRLWFRDEDGKTASDRAWFHTNGKTTYWHNLSGGAKIPKGEYKLSGYMEGELSRPFDPARIRWHGDITM